MNAKNVLITVLSVMLVSVSALCIYLGVELKNEKRHKANHETVESVVYDTVCVEKCSIKPVIVYETDTICLHDTLVLYRDIPKYVYSNPQLNIPKKESDNFEIEFEVGLKKKNDKMMPSVGTKFKYKF